MTALLEAEGGLGAGGTAGEAGGSPAWDGHHWRAGAKHLVQGQSHKHKYPRG